MSAWVYSFAKLLVKKFDKKQGLRPIIWDIIYSFNWGLCPQY